jgi:hypothetical protein
MLRIRFIAGRGTLNTVVYAEQPEPGEGEVVKTLYMQRAALRKMAPAGQEFPEYLYVTIEAG